MIEIVLQFEGRVKLMQLKAGEERELREEFKKLCSRDPVLLRRTVTHHPTFKVFNARCGLDVEIEPWDTIENGCVVKVFFAPFALDLSDVPIVHTAIDSGSDQIQTESTSTSAVSRNADQQFLHELGVHSTNRFDSFSNTKKHQHGQNSREESAPGTIRLESMVEKPQHQQNRQVPSVPSTSTAARPKRKSISQRTNHVLSSDSERDDEYENNNVAALNSNRQRLQELFNIADPVPKLRTQKKTKRKGGTADKENCRRVSLPRAVKSRKITADAPPAPNLDETLGDAISLPNSPVSGNPQAVNLGDTLDDDTFALSMSPVSGNAQEPQSSDKQQQNTGKVSKVKRRKPNIKRRLIGERITIYTVLPPFPQKLQESIDKGLVYIKQKHTQRMNKFLQSHILNVTKGLYCTKGEHKILRSQVVNRLTSMNAPNIELYKKLLIKRLSASNRNIRNYRQNKLPRLQSMRNAQKEADETESETEWMDNPRVLTAEEADHILRQPVMNKVTVQNAIEISSHIRADYARCHSATDMMDTYPFLKSTELLLHDYSTRVPLSLNLIEQNFNSSLQPLSTILSLEEPKDELQKIKLVVSINEYFTDDNRNDFPCVQLWDAHNNSAAPLNDIPQTQAPALVVAVSDKDIASASVVFDGGYLFSHKEPTAFQCTALLIASYLVYQVAYPEQYKRQLSTLQYILHGEKKSHVLEISLRNFLLLIRGYAPGRINISSIILLLQRSTSWTGTNQINPIIIINI